MTRMEPCGALSIGIPRPFSASPSDPGSAPPCDAPTPRELRMGCSPVGLSDSIETFNHKAGLQQQVVLVVGECRGKSQQNELRFPSKCQVLPQSAEAAARMFVWQLPRSLAAPPRVQPQSQRKNDQMWCSEGAT